MISRFNDIVRRTPPVPILTTAALGGSLFFIGTNIEVFSSSLALLIVALAGALWRGYRGGIEIPRSALAVSLSLLWLWFAVTLVWSPVPFVSNAMFWWLSSLPLAFWLYTLLPTRERHWMWFAVPSLCIGYALALTGTFQVLVRGQAPDTVFLDVNTQAALLVLLALPVGGYFLRQGVVARPDIRLTGFLGFSFFLLVYNAMLTRSRGGILAFLIGTLLLFVVAARRVPKKLLVAYALFVGLAILLANLSWQGALFEKMSTTISDVQGATTPRFVIWRESWRLLFEQSPFWGIGLGLYSLLWPPYRAPEDNSGGYFVHNDYLQFWIEAGLPGLLLLLLVLTSVAWMVWQMLRNRDLPVAERIEIAGLFAGFAAIAAHSVVQYNFYIIPILLLCGLILARLQEFAILRRSVARSVWRWRPEQRFTATGYRVIVAAVALLPFSYFAAIGVSSYEIARASPLAREGRLEESERALILAEHLWPDSDTPLFGRADLYRHLLTTGAGVLTADKRQELFQNAESLLQQAENRNPFRSHIFLVRGNLYALGPVLAGPDWKQKAEQAYRRALALAPRYYPARYAYGRFLLRQGEGARAFAVLEEGMRYQYTDYVDILPYFTLLAELRERAGNHDGARELRERVEYYVKHEMRPPTPAALSVPPPRI